MAKKKYVPKGFESTLKKKDTSANIYESMMMSDAWKDLTKQQQILYVYCKQQYYGHRKPPQDIPGVDDRCFYFNWALNEEYDIYKNKKSFYDGLKALVDHGFIKVVFNGGPYKQRSIYRYSEQWKFWKKE